MCYSLEEFAQTSATKPVLSNWLLVNNIPKIKETITTTPIIVAEPKPDLAVTNNSNIKFYADKDSITLGESTFIHWDIPSEVKVTLSYSLDGEKFENISNAFANKAMDRVNPKSTTFYKIKAEKVEKIIKVNVIKSVDTKPKPVKPTTIEYFYFENDEVKLGNSTTLKWSVNNIANVILETSVNGVNWSVEENVLYGNIGEKIIYPKRKIYYKLVATDDTTIIRTLNVTDN